MTAAPPTHPPATAQLAGAAVGGLISGGVAYSQEYLRPEGNAVVTALGAIIGTLVIHLFYSSPMRQVALVIIVASAGGIVAAVMTLRDEAPSGVSTLAGGCDPFTVHAQNRWRPYGAAVRAAPYAAAKKVGGYESNELISVDGWVRTRAPYPTNNPPWNSDVWFHLSDDTGWVSFAGVRADPTPQDPTGMDPDGGRPAPTPAECSGSVNR